MGHTSVGAWEQCNHTRKNELNRCLVHALEQPPIWRNQAWIDLNGYESKYGVHGYDIGSFFGIEHNMLYDYA